MADGAGPPPVELDLARQQIVGAAALELPQVRRLASQRRAAARHPAVLGLQSPQRLQRGPFPGAERAAEVDDPEPRHLDQHVAGALGADHHGDPSHPHRQGPFSQPHRSPSERRAADWSARARALRVDRQQRDRRQHDRFIVDAP